MFKFKSELKVGHDTGAGEGRPWYLPCSVHYGGRDSCYLGFINNQVMEEPK